MDYHTAIQLSAMQAIEKPDYEACWRRVARAYSKAFYTPLHLVEELPEEVVLQHYYENLYSEMNPEERELEIEALLETPEKRAERENSKNSEAAIVASLAQDVALLEAVKVVGRKKGAPKDGVLKSSLASPNEPITKKTISQLNEIPPEIEMLFGE